MVWFEKPTLAVRKAWFRSFPHLRLAHRFGCAFVADPADGNDLRLLTGKRIEEAQRAYLAALCDACAPDRFIDCGANAGIYAVTMAKRREFPKGVDAFEPIPGTYAKLVANAAINGLLAVVRTHMLALGDQSGTATAYTMVGASGRSSLVRRAEAGRQSVEVTVRALDELIDAADETVAMKIDVEGFESRVLKGAARLLARNRVVLQIECYGDDPLHELQGALPPTYRLLRRIGPDHYFANFNPLGDAALR